MEASNAGGIGAIASSHQEERMVSGLQSMTIENGSSSSRADGPTNSMDVAYSNNTQTGNSDDMKVGIEGDTRSGESTPMRTNSPTTSEESDATIVPAQPRASADGATDPSAGIAARRTAAGWRAAADWTAVPLDDYPWPSQLLMILTNSIRQALKVVRIQDKDLGRLEELLHITLAQEESLHPTTISLISDSRFDKLLEALLRLDGQVLEHAPRLAESVSLAASLQLKWQLRFREDYFDLDLMRLKKFKDEGAFRAIVPKGRFRDISRMWSVTNTTPILNADLEPGMWWLNLACLRRDGIINSSREIVTIRPGVIILPLLSGTEYPGREPRTYIYKKEGQVRNLHVALMAPGGRKVKVFRGQTLKSKFAPAAGIRYDGEYTVESYGFQMEEKGHGIHSITVKLKAVQHQKAVNELHLIPNPSQLDDWELYNRVLADEIISHKGASKYYQWKFAQEQEEKARKHFLANEASFSRLAQNMRRYKAERLRVVSPPPSLETGGQRGERG